MKEWGSTHCICLYSGLHLAVHSGNHPARCVRRVCVNDNFTLIHLPLNSAVIYSELVTASPTQQRMHSLNNCGWFRETAVTQGSYFIPLIYSACPAHCAFIKIPFKYWQVRLHVVSTSVFQSRPCTVSFAREILCIENFFFFLSHNMETYSLCFPRPRPALLSLCKGEVSSQELTSVKLR